MRTLLAGVLGLTMCLVVATADDKKDKDKKGKGHEATITKIDTKNQTVTVKMKDKDGKETEKTFKLVETVRYVDSTGKVVAADFFKSGDYVLVLEEDGQLKEVRQAKQGNTKDKDKDKK